MTQGLQVFDDNGNITLDLTKQMPRIVGEMALNGDGEITSTSIGYPNNKLWYFIVSNISPADDINDTPFLRIDNNGTKISWGNQVGTRIRYGIY